MITVYIIKYLQILHSSPGPASLSGVTYYYFPFAEYLDHLGDYENKDSRQLPLKILDLRRTISLRPAPKLLLVRCPSQENVISKTRKSRNEQIL